MSNPREYDAVLGGDRPGPSLSTTSAVMGTTNRYTHPDHRQFCLDMAAAQLRVTQYEARFFWSGPAVQVGDIQDVLSCTKIKCLWETMGKNEWIVYPRSYCKDAVIEVKKMIDEENRLPFVHSRSDYQVSESYKRQFNALIEMIRVEFNLGLVE